MKKKILGLLIAFGLSVPAFASITVSPTRLEINANKIRNNYVSTAIEIKGETDKPVRYRAYAGYFSVSDKGDMLMDDNVNDSHNISKQIRFVPSEFTVPPGKSQKVRVNIANIKSLPDGESRAILYLEDVNPKEMNVPNNFGIGAQLILKTRVGVPVYVDKGNFKKIGDVESFEVIKSQNGYVAQAKILSKGNSKIRYYGKIQVVKGKKLIDEISIESHVVGAENSYTLKEVISKDKFKEAGEYTVRLVLTYNDENDNKKNIKKDAILEMKGEKI
ncbi:molecular chaperone [bacterium]|nr:molecular chaperone [bacterium]MBR1776571.1 molecular chaperone [bacterium]